MDGTPGLSAVWFVDGLWITRPPAFVCVYVLELHRLFVGVFVVAAHSPISLGASLRSCLWPLAVYLLCLECVIMWNSIVAHHQKHSGGRPAIGNNAGQTEQNWALVSLCMRLSQSSSLFPLISYWSTVCVSWTLCLSKRHYIGDPPRMADMQQILINCSGYHTPYQTMQLRWI